MNGTFVTLDELLAKDPLSVFLWVIMKAMEIFKGFGGEQKLLNWLPALGKALKKG